MDTRPLEPDAAAIAAMKPGELYWSVIQPVWKKLSFNDGSETFLIQLDQVHEDQGLLFAAHWLQSEVNAGGFQQFFTNPCGMLAPEAMRGLAMMKMGPAAEALRLAMAKFGKLYPRDKVDRQPKLDKLKKPGATRAEWDVFHGFDAQFQASASTAAFAAAADLFVREHPSMFFRTAAWRGFTHPDGRKWAVRTGVTGFELRIGAADDPNDPPVIRKRESKVPDAEVSKLVKDQLAEGFVADR